MKPMNRFYLLDNENNKVFGEGPYRLLKTLEETGSLRAAAQKMDMAYSKAIKMVKKAEEALAFTLTERAIGGRDGGGSMLTPQGKEFLHKYEAYRQRCNEACAGIYDEIFSENRISIGCVIMASGLGKRFGGNKLTADFGGIPLISRILQSTEALFESRVVVTRHREIEEISARHCVPVVLHGLPHRSDTVRLGVEKMKNMQGCMFCPGDQPLLSRESLIAMRDTFIANPGSIVRLAWKEKQSAPVIFPECMFDELKNLPEGRGGNLLIEKYPDRVICVQAKSPLEIKDIDTPDDLLLLLPHIGLI